MILDDLAGQVNRRGRPQIAMWFSRVHLALDLKFAGGFSIDFNHAQGICDDLCLGVQRAGEDSLSPMRNRSPTFIRNTIVTVPYPAQWLERPARYRRSARFETSPSNPIVQPDASKR
jgi:hypothetical protein